MSGIGKFFRSVVGAVPITGILLQSTQHQADVKAKIAADNAATNQSVIDTSIKQQQLTDLTNSANDQASLNQATIAGAMAKAGTQTVLKYFLIGLGILVIGGGFVWGLMYLKKKKPTQ